MIAAGAAHIIDTTANTVLASGADRADAFPVMVAVPSVVAEGWFWLALGFGLLTRPSEVKRSEGHEPDPLHNEGTPP